MTSTSIAGGNVTSPARRNSATRRAFLRFLVVGSTSVLIDLVVYQALTAAGWSPHGSKGISYVAGMAFGFVANKLWAFGSKRKSLAEPATYAALYATTLGVNVGLNAAVLALLGVRFTLPAFLVATGTTTVLNFAGLRWVTFRKGMATT
jgi:putative flippase GtrA